MSGMRFSKFIISQKDMEYTKMDRQIKPKAQQQLKKLLLDSQLPFCFSRLKGRKYLFFEILSYSDEQSNVRTLVLGAGKAFRVLLVKDYHIFNKIVYFEEILHLEKRLRSDQIGWLCSGGVKDHSLHVEVSQWQLSGPDFKALVNQKEKMKKLKSNKPNVVILQIDLSDNTRQVNGYLKNLIEFQQTGFDVLEVQKLILNGLRSNQENQFYLKDHCQEPKPALVKHLALSQVYNSSQFLQLFEPTQYLEVDLYYINGKEEACLREIEMLLVILLASPVRPQLQFNMKPQLDNNVKLLISVCTSTTLHEFVQCFGKIIVNCNDMEYKCYRDLVYKAKNEDVYIFQREPNRVQLAMNSALLESLAYSRLMKLSLIVDVNFAVHKYLEILEDLKKQSPSMGKNQSIQELQIQVKVQSKLDITPILEYIMDECEGLKTLVISDIRREGLQIQLLRLKDTINKSSIKSLRLEVQVNEHTKKLLESLDCQSLTSLTINEISYSYKCTNHLQPFQGSQNLTSLELTIREHFSITYNQFLQSLPNLRSLKLDLGYKGSGMLQQLIAYIQSESAQNLQLLHIKVKHFMADFIPLVEALDIEMPNLKNLKVMSNEMGTMTKEALEGLIRGKHKKIILQASIRVKSTPLFQQLIPMYPHAIIDVDNQPHC
ncbi:hypothetical protein FGO68_gene11470 [Halteria grandinella]|uniref:Uncharacterized protein n=1 Tax=Halteria grandinella TaxID=5974 RepID=A0A8J8NWA2_HALGN|nr:hypothetical protein FGO68_gene11470 [Halteria grandinella]